jgi:hypothetical protein
MARDRIDVLRRMSVEDAYSANRSAVAAALAGVGDEATARKVLLALLDLDDDIAVLDAMSRIENLGWIDQVPFPTVRRLADARAAQPYSARVADYWRSPRSWRRWWPW